MPAHLTLFHALPGDEAVPIRRVIEALCRREKPFDLEATGLRSLGRGVAISFKAPAIVRIRDELARDWRDDLTAQDSARIAPHVTIQNKVSPNEARALLAELSVSFRPFTARGEGLNLWHYRGGPWELAGRFTFDRH